MEVQRLALDIELAIAVVGADLAQRRQRCFHRGEQPLCMARVASAQCGVMNQDAEALDAAAAFRDVPFDRGATAVLPVEAGWHGTSKLRTALEQGEVAQSTPRFSATQEGGVSEIAGTNLTSAQRSPASKADGASRSRATSAGTLLAAPAATAQSMNSRSGPDPSHDEVVQAVLMAAIALALLALLWFIP
ncbi:MAG TPA: hypothetical protein VFU71_17490 [Burkholderiaceae bacterium]|nr:hypothetical protein [Burkholderiaceae bacterium]